MSQRVWRVRGQPLEPETGSGVLTGSRVAVKDLIAVAGHRRGAGNPTWLREAPVESGDAPVVAALRAAGASIAGIAQTDELAFSLSGTNIHYGTPANPRAPERIPGGSSSGPASAVAGGEADIGLGTDTAGSIRVPASVCGLWGIRPTHGVISVSGVLALAPSFDTVGWLTREPGLLRRVADVLLPAPAPAPPAAARILLPGSCYRGAAQGGTLLDVAGTIARRTGLAVAQADPEVLRDQERLGPAFRLVQAAQAWQQHGSWIDAHPGALGADVEGRFRYGKVAPSELDAATRTLRHEVDRLRELVGDGTILVVPAAVGPGHRRAAPARQVALWRSETLRLTVPASAAGLPAVVFPALDDPANPGPVGLCAIGAPGTDRALIDLLTRAVE